MDVSFVIIARISQKQWDDLWGRNYHRRKSKITDTRRRSLVSMQKEVRKTDGRVSPSKGEREGERIKGGRIRLLVQKIFPCASICTRTLVSISGVRPKLHRGLHSGRGIDRSCGIGMQLIMHRPGQCTCDFCEVRKENRAARVACNQSHAVRARCIVLCAPPPGDTLFRS